MSVVNNFNKKAFCFCSSGGGRVGYPGIPHIPGYPTSWLPYPLYPTLQISYPLNSLSPGIPYPRYLTSWIPYPLSPERTWDQGPRRDLASEIPSPPVMNREMPVKTLPSSNYCCGWLLISEKKS